jgi:hypothetical protein
MGTKQVSTTPVDARPKGDETAEWIERLEGFLSSLPTEPMKLKGQSAVMAQAVREMERLIGCLIAYEEAKERMTGVAHSEPKQKFREVLSRFVQARRTLLANARFGPTPSNR